MKQMSQSYKAIVDNIRDIQPDFVLEDFLQEYLDALKLGRDRFYHQIEEIEGPFDYVMIYTGYDSRFYDDKEKYTREIRNQIQDERFQYEFVDDKELIRGMTKCAFGYSTDAVLISVREDSDDRPRELRSTSLERALDLSGAFDNLYFYSCGSAEIETIKYKGKKVCIFTYDAESG